MIQQYKMHHNNTAQRTQSRCRFNFLRTSTNNRGVNNQRDRQSEAGQSFAFELPPMERQGIAAETPSSRAVVAIPAAEVAPLPMGHATPIIEGNKI